jgi:nicotinamide-nucleotide amidase
MALPGPPGELVPMFEKDIAPYIRKKFKPGCVFRTRTVKMTGLPESCVNNSVKDLLKLEPPTTVGIYAKPGEVDLVIMSKAKSASAASRAILKVEKKIKSRLKGHIFGYDDETLESAVGSMLIRKSMTIAVAESCTGGLISSRLTDVSGSSRYFIRGAVPYANEVKIKHVGVSEKTLSRYGAVSRQVALEMATGLKSLMRVDVCLGVTGIAGPTGGSADKPVGLVYIAIDAPRRRAVKKFMFKGSRSDIKFQASQAALDLIRKNI